MGFGEEVSSGFEMGTRTGEVCNFIQSLQSRTISTQDHRPQSSYKFVADFAFSRRPGIVSVSMVHQ